MAVNLRIVKTMQKDVGYTDERLLEMVRVRGRMDKEYFEEEVRLLQRAGFMFRKESLLYKGEP